MQPGDLMMLGAAPLLFSTEDALELDLAYGDLFDVVIVIRRSESHTFVRVLHPTLGLRDVYALHLHPMTGGNNEAR